MSASERYWFPAKRFGWGWGPPATWQGWVVFAVWFAALAAGIIVLARHRQWLPWGLLYVTGLCGVLMIICLLKGEPPRWRWGGESDRES